MDVFNPQDQPVTWRVQVADSRSFVYETSGALIPKKVTNILILLDDLVQKRLDLSNIRSLKFALDTTGAVQPVVAYLDYVRLEGEVVPTKKK
jgi:predicted metal-dependent peptidase